MEEYSLEDVLETLKDVHRARYNELERLRNITANNEVNSLSQSNTLEEIKEKQHRFYHGLLTHVRQEEPKDYPIPRTKDLQDEAMFFLEENVQDAERLLRLSKEHLSRTMEDIEYLEGKKKGFEKMKSGYLGAAKVVANRTYAKEYAITKKLFNQVKADLKTVVDTLFPGNAQFQDFFADLTGAYSKGGDSVYVDVTPETIDHAEFLITADIAAFHPNDKTKIRLKELL